MRSLTKFMALMALACAVLFSTGIARADHDHGAAPCGGGPITVKLLSVNGTTGTFQLCNTTNAAINNVGVASYAIVEPIGCPGTVTQISSQYYLDSKTGINIPANTCVQTTLKMAPCFTQVDVFTGPVITQFIGSTYYGYGYPGPNVNLQLLGGGYFATDTLASLHEVTQTSLRECNPNICTYTQGGYSQEPKGNNVGAYLAANFGTAFPNGLIIGTQSTGLFVKLNSPAEIREFIRSRGGTPGPLNSPRQGGNLATQTVTLTLNVGFSPALGGMVYCPSDTTDSLRGQTVAQILVAANIALGGGTLPLGYSYSRLNDLVTNINEAYHECNESAWAKANLKLTCP